MNPLLPTSSRASSVATNRAAQPRGRRSTSRQPINLAAVHPTSRLNLAAHVASAATNRLAATKRSELQAILQSFLQPILQRCSRKVAAHDVLHRFCQLPPSAQVAARRVSCRDTPRDRRRTAAATSRLHAPSVWNNSSLRDSTRPKKDIARATTRAKEIPETSRSRLLSRTISRLVSRPHGFMLPKHAARNPGPPIRSALPTHPYRCRRTDPQPRIVHRQDPPTGMSVARQEISVVRCVSPVGRANTQYEHFTNLALRPAKVRRHTANSEPRKRCHPRPAKEPTDNGRKAAVTHESAVADAPSEEGHTEPSRMDRTPHGRASGRQDNEA